MTVKLLDETAAGGEKREVERADVMIRDHVLRALGSRPVGLLRVEVRRLWENHYRVNVYVGADAASATIPHSYFVVADAAGNVTATTPKLGGPR